MLHSLCLLLVLQDTPPAKEAPAKITSYSEAAKIRFGFVDFYEELRKVYEAIQTDKEMFATHSQQLDLDRLHKKLMPLLADNRRISLSEEDSKKLREESNPPRLKARAIVLKRHMELWEHQPRKYQSIRSCEVTRWVENELVDIARNKIKHFEAALRRHMDSHNETPEKLDVLLKENHPELASYKNTTDPWHRPFRFAVVRNEARQASCYVWSQNQFEENASLEPVIIGRPFPVNLIRVRNFTQRRTAILDEATTILNKVKGSSVADANVTLHYLSKEFSALESTLHQIRLTREEFSSVSNADSALFVQARQRLQQAHLSLWKRDAVLYGQLDVNSLFTLGFNYLDSELIWKDIMSLRADLIIFHGKHHRWPQSLSELPNDCKTVDPWGKTYQFAIDPKMDTKSASMDLNHIYVWTRSGFTQGKRLIGAEPPSAR